MDGLEELTLVFPNPGVVWLLHQPGVFVDEPRLPENVSSGIFHLGPEKEQFPISHWGNRGTVRLTCQGQLVSCTWLPGPIIPASHCLDRGGAVTGHTGGHLWPSPRLCAQLTGVLTHGRAQCGVGMHRAGW